MATHQTFNVRFPYVHCIAKGKHQLCNSRVIFYFVIKSQALRAWYLESLCAKRSLLRRKTVSLPFERPPDFHALTDEPFLLGILHLDLLSRNHRTAHKSKPIVQNLAEILLDNSFDRTNIAPIHLIMFSAFSFLPILN